MEYGELKVSEASSGVQRSQFRFTLAFWAMFVVLITPVMVLASMVATSSGYVDYELGYHSLTLGYGPKIATLSFIFALLALLISIFKDPSRTGVLALVASLVGGAVLLGYYSYERLYKAFPPIHDVATDWTRPITFSDALVKERGPKALPIEEDPMVPADASIEWARKRIALLNEQTCKTAKPIKRHLDENKVKAVLEDQGYVIFGHAPWRVEATYKDAFFGFKSDVEVRLEPDQTDVRMVSRRQEADLGGNCRRVTKLLEALNQL